MNQETEILQKIQQVDTPPFLYTRILQRINAVQEAPVPVKLRYAFAAAALLIILLNIGTWAVNSSGTKQAVPEGNGNSPYVTVQNDIYHD